MTFGKRMANKMKIDFELTDSLDLLDDTFVEAAQ
jgi:hypothetical protein